ncbi:MAG: hypothetical protein IT260_02490 [Saprospiraceae bacterium]|nr:hypothetical protein [Saprospiraceae bacterium]
MNAREKDQFLSHWTLLRRRGMFVYLLSTALSWGTLTAIFLRIFDTLYTHGLTRQSLVKAFLSQGFLSFWGMFVLGGLFFASVLWYYYGWLYRKYRPGL